MAISSIGTRGTQVSGAAGTTVARAPSATVAAGRVLICQVAQNGNASTTVTDAVGNTWEFLGSGSNSAGNARSDVWMCNVETQLTTANSITVTFGASVTHKSMSLWEFSVDAGNILIESATAVANESTGNGFGSVSFSSLASKQRLYLRALAKQANSTTAITATSGFTTQALTLRSANNTAAIAQRGEFRINTSTGETSNPTLAVAGNTGNVFVALEEYTPPAAQPLTQASRFDNDQTFYAATLTQSAAPQSLLPGLYSNDQAFYGPTVTNLGGVDIQVSWVTFDTQAAGTTTLRPSLLESVNAFYQPIVVPGAVQVQPSLYTNTQTFYPQTLTRGAVTLTPARLNNVQAFYSPTVATGAAVLLPSRLDNAQIFYAPLVLAGGQSLQPSRLDNTQAFYAHSLTAGAVGLQAALFVNASGFFDAVVTDGAEPQPSARPGFEMGGRKVYIKRGKRIHIFDTVEDADAWVEAEQQATQALQKVPAKKKPKAKAKVYKALDEQLPHEVIRLDWLESLVAHFNIPVELPTLEAKQDWLEVARIALLAQQMQDDEEVELLLMA